MVNFVVTRWFQKYRVFKPISQITYVVQVERDISDTFGQYSQNTD